MCQLAHHGREITVDVVQVHHIGAELVEHRLKALLNVIHAQGAPQGTQLVPHPTAKVHLAGKPVLETRRQVFGILHGKHLDLDTAFTQHRLGIEDDHTVAPTRIIELIDQQYPHLFSVRSEVLEVGGCPLEPKA